MRVALVHDWLTGMRGGERVLHQLARLYPDADLYTLFHVPEVTTSRIEALDITASPLNRLPGVRRHYRKLLPLFPWAIGRFRLDDYDLVISTSHAVAKSVETAPGIPHLDYCFTPMRYIWDQLPAYLGRGPRRAAAMPLVHALRRFDVAHSGPASVTRFVAISKCVADRIARHYGRRASVVHPPIELDRFKPSSRPPEDFFLMVGGFVPYKREALAIAAFRRFGSRLLVVGDGPTRARLEQGAPANVEFLGRVSDDELARLYGHARALVHPQEEDFGLVALEAQAAGRPVIAYAGGGALETVRPLRDGNRTDEPNEGAATGVYFSDATPEALRAALQRFQQSEHHFDPKLIRDHAENFGVERFDHQFRGEVDRALAGEG